MSEIEGLCECKPEILGQDFYNKYNQLITKISSLRDKGKLVIPNTFPERYGAHKAEAYQGFRHKSLSCLTAAYYLAISINFSREGYNKVSANIEHEDFASLQTLDKKSDEFILLKQAEKIKKGLDKLPDGYLIDGPIINGRKSPGWSTKKAIVETKRQFVSKSQKLIKARSWEQKLIELSEQDE